METYTLLRAFADSWFLIAMFSFFIGAALWAYWPSQKSARQDASEIPFREDTSCTENCADCTCKIDLMKGVGNV